MAQRRGKNEERTPAETGRFVGHGAMKWRRDPSPGRVAAVMVAAGGWGLRILAWSLKAAYVSAAVTAQGLARIIDRWRPSLRGGRQDAALIRLAIILSVLPLLWSLQIWAWVLQKLYELCQGAVSRPASTRPVSLPDEVRATLGTALREAWEIKDAVGDQNLCLTSQAMYEMAKALRDAALDGEARRVVEELAKIPSRTSALDLDSRVETLDQVVRGLVAAGQLEEAVSLCRKSEHAIGGRPDAREQDTLLRIGIQGLLEEAGEFGRARDLLREIGDEEQRDYARHDLATALMKSGRMDEALVVIDQISDEEQRAFTLSSVCDVLSRDGRVAEALGVARRIEGAASSFRQSALFSVAEGLAAIGRGEETQVVVREALELEGNERDWAAFRAAAIIARAGGVDEALTLARSIEGYYSPQAFAEICRVLTLTGRIAQALEIASRLRDDSDRVLVEIAKAEAEAGDGQRASEVARRIADADKRAEALAGVARALATRGEIEGAMNLVGEIPEQYSYRASDTYDVVVETLGRQGQIEEALGVVAQYDPVSRVIALAKMHQALTRDGG